ncbi:MAG: ribosomal protein S18-alanine N-acetyltransferase [bacterium]|nr:ribosomal protein S18-alanine N-acetyltransferase [bacterium]
MKQVLEIERLCFKEPYSRQIFEQELKIKAAILWVVPYRNRVIGYIDYWVVADQMELVSIAVHPKYKGRGVGKFLMGKMVKDGKEKAVSSIILDVRRSNRKAQKLYRKFGFKKVGLRKRYYSDSQEDAIIMKRAFL